MYKAAAYDTKNLPLEGTRKTAPGQALPETADKPKGEVVELFGTAALFFDERVGQEAVPEGLFRYDLRGSDDDPGDPAAVEDHVLVNHAGTILMAKPLDIPENGFLELGDGLNFTGGEMTVDEFRAEYAGHDAN